MSTLTPANAISSEQRAEAFAASYSTEFSIVLACCRAELRPNDANLREWLGRAVRDVRDWARVFELGEHHGVLPAMHRALCGREAGAGGGFPAGSLPEQLVLRKVCDELERRTVHLAMKNLRLAAELIHILNCLERSGIAAIPHKGPVLAETVYGDLARRDFSDLDVLIRAEDVARAKQALAQIGYKANIDLSPAEERAYLASGYEYTFDGPAGKNLLEIQWDFVPRFFSVDFDMGAVFARAGSGVVAGRVVRTLAPEDLFLSMCVHAAKHLWGRLCWLRDLAHVAEKMKIDWERVQSEAGRLGIQRIVSVSLRLARVLVGAEVSREARAALGDDEHDEQAEMMTAAIVQHISTAEDYSTESVDYVRWMLRLRERPSDRWRYVSRLLFTPSLGEWAWMKLPEPLFPVYRGVRVIRVGGRLLRSFDRG